MNYFRNLEIYSRRFVYSAWWNEIVNHVSLGQSCPLSLTTIAAMNVRVTRHTLLYSFIISCLHPTCLQMEYLRPIIIANEHTLISQLILQLN